MNPHRLLIATDVPFWRKSTGAEQRISSLIRFLTSQSIVVRTFYLGQTGTGQFTDDDQRLILNNSLDVQQRSSDQPPQGLTDKIGWYATATLNQIRQLAGSRSSESAIGESPASLTLDDFRWPWAIKAFAESVKEFQPDSVMIEYVKLSYLLEALSPQQRDSTCCLVDTHDVLHVRCEQFRDNGFSHWIEINRDEESRELAKFDVVMAIQSEEALLFQEMAPSAKTIVCGHVPESPKRLSNGKDSLASSGGQSTLRVGYLASTNWSNAQAIDSFLQKVWAPLVGDSKPNEFKLIVGGSICEFVDSKTQAIGFQKSPNIELLGRVNELATFYDSVDLVINPVEFGTGLKIKTAEALAFGIPVLTTVSGTAGLSIDFQLGQAEHNCPVLVCDSPEKFATELASLANSATRLQECSEAAKQLAKAAFSEQQAYSALKQCLQDAR